MVVKSAESTSLIRIAELAQETEVFAGVLNVLAFAASGATGAPFDGASARSNMKRVYLELGRKSPNTVFADARGLKKRSKSRLRVFSATQVRPASRPCLLVERSIQEEYTTELIKAADAMTIGDPLDLRIAAGAVISARQLKQNLAFVAEARTMADLCRGCAQLHAETGGFHMAPAIVPEVQPTNRLFREEVFGPVLVITPCDTRDEALANDTEFGRSVRSGPRPCRAPTA